MTEGLRRAAARLKQPAYRPWSPSGRRRGSEVPVSRPRSSPSAAARLPPAVASWSKRIDPLLRHEVEGVHRLGSLGYQVGPPEPQRTTTVGPRVRSGWEWDPFLTGRPHMVWPRPPARTLTVTHPARGYTTHDRARISLASHTSHRRGDKVLIRVYPRAEARRPDGGGRRW